MGAHLYRGLDIATEFDQSALAVVSGEGCGPPVHIDQCTWCNVARFESEGRYRYAAAGQVWHVEPNCAERPR